MTIELGALKHPQLGDPVAVYPYQRLSGDVAFVVCRFDPKDFRPARLASNGRWAWSLNGTPALLYRLPDVERALAVGETIWIVDGEKDADAIASAGGIATCCARSQGWTLELAEQLAGARRVRIVGDRDKNGTGARQAVQVRDLLIEAGAIASVDIELVQAAAGKDSHDHLAAGRTLDDFCPLELGELTVEQNGRPTDPGAVTDERLSLRGLDTYCVRQVEWLDKPFLQRSAFHLLAGRKGSCKGTYLCGLAARVSRGALYPEPKRVLVITSEDSVELDFLPRILAAGGDPSMVAIVNGAFRLPADLDWLRYQATALRDVGLIVIDPIGNHLGGADTDKEGLVRDAIQDLNPLADELDCIVFGVRHLGKDVTRGALASVLGSTAWVDVPRCVILMAPDDEDERLFHAQVVAGNRGPKNHGRAFRLELVDVLPATDITLAVPHGESTKDVEALLAVRTGESAPTSRSAKASARVLDILESEGEQESDALDARIAGEIGIAAKTVRNLRTKLRGAGLINIAPEKDELGTVTHWVVTRTHAPRDPDPVAAGRYEQIPLNHAEFPTTSLESVSKGPGHHIPSQQSEDVDGAPPLDDLAADAIQRTLEADGAAA